MFLDKMIEKSYYFDYNAEIHLFKKMRILNNLFKTCFFHQILCHELKKQYFSMFFQMIGHSIIKIKK